MWCHEISHRLRYPDSFTLHSGHACKHATSVSGVLSLFRQNSRSVASNCCRAKSALSCQTELHARRAKWAFWSHKHMICCHTPVLSYRISFAQTFHLANELTSLNLPRRQNGNKCVPARPLRPSASIYSSTITGLQDTLLKTAWPQSENRLVPI